MTASSPALALATALGLVITGPTIAQNASAPQGASASMSASATVVSDVEPGAYQAMQRMSAYLGTLNSFQMTAESSIDLVLEDNQKVKLDGVTTYKVRRPNGFVIENVTDRKVRRFLYDGKQLTVYAPKRGFYATVPAPPTIRQTLDAAWDKYGIVLPLEDLLHWSEPDATPGELDSAFLIGTAMVGGVETDHYAFSEAGLDWQVWIQKGDKPLPRKVVIVDRWDPASPEYSARLSWNLNPGFTDATFAFRPDQDAKPIRFASK